MIFKIQLPLVTNDPNPHAFMYNEDRSVEFTCPIESVEEWFIENPCKVFVDATYDDDANKLVIHELVEDEEW